MNTNQEMNRKINQAFANATPDVLDSVLADCKEQKGARTMTKKTNPSGSWLKPIISIAAAILLLVGSIAGIQIYNTNHAVASTVLLDVNPSVEIQVNKNETVLKVIAHNEDGRRIIGDMDFEGSDLDVTVNALIGSMLTNGYLSELANSILISVDGKDAEKNAALQEKLTAEINRLLQTDSWGGAVLSQTISQNTELQKLADDNGITLGKAQLIQEILSSNPLHTFEELVPLTINELNLLAAAASQPLDKVESVGSASEKAYITRDAAKEAALTHAGVTADAIRDYEIEMDWERGLMVYEIEFTCDGYEYDYDINATTGEVVKLDKDRDDDRLDDNSGTTGGNAGDSDNRISADAAKEAALNHAGVTADSIRDYDCELDWENGILVYDIDFESGDYDYSYDINAVTGEVIKSDKELETDNDDLYDDDLYDDLFDDDDDDDVVQPTPGAIITDAEAKNIALNHAGVTADNIRDYSCELDEDDGVPVYEIEFESGDTEYSYEIKAENGEIVKAEKEKEN